MSLLRAGTPLDGGSCTIVPIEEVGVDSYPAPGGAWAYGYKAPAAVIVCRPPEIRAVGMRGEDIDVDELAGRVPGLSALLDAYRS